MHLMKYIITYRKVTMARGRDNLKYRQRPIVYKSIEFNRYRKKDSGFDPDSDQIDKATKEFLAKGGSIQKSDYGANPELDNEDNPLSPDEIQNILEEWKI